MAASAGKRLSPLLTSAVWICLASIVDSAKPTIGIIGTGRLAASLGAGLVLAGRHVRVLVGRDPVRTEALAALLGPQVVPTTDMQGAVAACDIVFLALPDGAIAPACAALHWESRHAVVHCSGALGLGVLSPATTAGAEAGCLHPLQSFPSRLPEPERFRGIFCGIEGAKPLGTLLETLAVELGARTFRLEGVDRALYHASAVFISNHLLALAVAAEQAWTISGLPRDAAREALAPLLLTTAANVARLPLAEALTGPVARGDATTIERHLAALAAAPSLAELYRRLSAQLLELPLGHDPAVHDRLRAMLTE